MRRSYEWRATHVKGKYGEVISEMVKVNEETLLRNIHLTLRGFLFSHQHGKYLKGKIRTVSFYIS